MERLWFRGARMSWSRLRERESKRSRWSADRGVTDRVLIVVDDDGPGIPLEEQEKVFAPFYRHDPARDPAKAAVGLGLSIARTVAREHGGDVTLKNWDSGGLSALIELPA